MGFSFLEHTYSDLMVTLYHMLSTVSTPLRKLFVESISFFLFLYMRQNKILPYYQGNHTECAGMPGQGRSALEKEVG